MTHDLRYAYSARSFCLKFFPVVTGWFGRHAHWGTGAFLWRMFALVTLVDVVALNSLYFTAADGTHAPDDVGLHCPRIDQSNYWILVRFGKSNVFLLTQISFS